MDFPALWSDFEAHAQHTALVEAATGRSVTYAELSQFIGAVRAQLPEQPKRLIALKVAPTIDSTALYLGALSAGHAVLLGSALTAATLAAFRPDMIVRDAQEGAAALAGYRAGDPLLGHDVMVPVTPDGGAIHPAIALVIPTSGSTGAKRFIKLSYQNIHAGAAQVAAGLGITAADRAITNLPLDYVYGLSILHSHLKAGASIVLEADSFLKPKFWDTFREHRVTGLGGVPFTYQSLKQIGFDRFELPSLMTLTQAGGALSLELRSWLACTFVPRGVRVFFMYGLSEASGRVTILPQAGVEAQAGAVGVAVPFGELSIGENDEVIYRGPNVMLGYAKDRSDLQSGDTLGGVLRTGDQGVLSADGHLTIKGRLSRFGKVFGKRVALDELQEAYAGNGILCMDASDDTLNVYHDGSAADALRALVMRLCRDLRVPPQAVRSHQIAELPRTANGKIDYVRLLKMAQS